MRRRRGAGQRSAGMELGGMRPQSAAMHLGIVVESCVLSSCGSIRTRSLEVSAEKGKVVQGDKDSTLEVRAGVF